ncbi:heme lyase NrfEFG subunit NrfF [Paraferrimonas sp. SM1919]|uniref:heme lyase NrfEFG subunit NrfF n=1 Tax=Paraferrimonas sp. SM1919 TaxID=2662263 RepID=UPI0013D62500|nr:heme lyase NrfEFG subunit NrfF [Paraferrimonas sp. SM1919]
MKYLVSLVLVVASALVNATPVDTFEFSTIEKQKIALKLAAELRCPQCQNQNLIDSNSPVAKDLRLEVYQMVELGKSEAEVIEFMTARYGDFVLYKPKLDERTYILWLAPGVIALLCLIFIAAFARRTKQANKQQQVMSEAEQQKLKQLLDD